MCQYLNQPPRIFCTYVIQKTKMDKKNITKHFPNYLKPDEKIMKRKKKKTVINTIMMTTTDYNKKKNNITNICVPTYTSMYIYIYIYTYCTIFKALYKRDETINRRQALKFCC